MDLTLKIKVLIEDVRVAGSVTGNNDVAGIVNKIDEDGKIENVAFIGKINSVGNNSTVGGLLAQTTWDLLTEPMWMRLLRPIMPMPVCWYHMSPTCLIAGSQEPRLE